jgi:hypothetical protein
MNNYRHTATLEQSEKPAAIADAGMTPLSGVKHIVLSWVLFSILFWIAAWNKPFHVDEFYSWVYAERSSFSEIILLKEFGIGHPPLYHLIQKTVQTAFRDYHPFQVRLANYFIGSIFVAVLVKTFSRYKSVPIFFYGVACSAAVLDTFVFSRMWGLVLLLSLFLITSGERYKEQKSWGGLIAIIVISILGLLSDYSFIMLSVYLLMVLTEIRLRPKAVFFASSALIAVMAVLSYTMNIHTTHDIFYKLLRAPAKIAYEMVHTIFNYRFQEPLVLSLLIVWIALLIMRIKKRTILEGEHTNANALFFVLSVLTILTSMDCLIRSDILRVRDALPFLIGILIGSYYSMRTQSFHSWCNLNDCIRLSISIICAFAILISVNSLFWRDLIDARFLIVLLPFILLILYRYLAPRPLRIISMILMFTGILYITSNAVSDFVPPPAIKHKIPVIFQYVNAYSTQYLTVDKIINRVPFIIDFSHYYKNCKTCVMGTDKISYEHYDSLWVVGSYDWNPSSILPKEFALAKSCANNYTWSDRVQFEYLTPITPWHFCLSEYKRTLKP